MTFPTYPHLSINYPHSIPLFFARFLPSYPHFVLSVCLVVDTQTEKTYTFPRVILITTSFVSI